MHNYNCLLLLNLKEMQTLQQAFFSGADLDGLVCSPKISTRITSKLWNSLSSQPQLKIASTVALTSTVMQISHCESEGHD